MNYYPMPNHMFAPFPMGGRAPFQPTLAPPLYIGNLDETVHEEQLFAHFSRYGPLHSLKIVKDRSTNRTRGFGYINFMNAKDAEQARLLSQYEKIGKSPIRIMYKRNVHDTQGCNLFVKDIDTTVSFKELHNFFARYGNVLTVKIAANNKGESLGYGYVLMEKKEDSLKAIAALNGAKLKEKEINCSEFKPKGERGIHTNKNLYVKGLPTNITDENAMKEIIHTQFSKYGTITSHAARQTKDGKWFAFVSYEDTNSAEEAKKHLEGVTLLGSAEPLYVAKHQARHERDFQLKKNYTAVKNDTNLFIRNLKPDVTNEALRHAFSQFGEIGNVGFNTKTIKQDDTRGYGFICFKDAQDALKAQTEGPRSEDIGKLFIEGQEPYVSFWQSKNQRDQFRASKMRRPFDHQRMQPQFSMPRGNPFGQMQNDPRMMNFPPFPMMNPNMMRSPYAGVPRTQPTHHRYPQHTQRRQGGYQQGNRPMGQRPYNPNANRMGHMPQNRSAPTGARPGQRNDYQHNQGGQQQHLQPSKDIRPAQQKEDGLEAHLTVQSLKDKLEDFLKLEPEKQRNILGELLYPQILKTSRPEHAPKITGMLVDFEVLTVQDILEMLEDDQVLAERISEAQELIETEGHN